MPTPGQILMGLGLFLIVTGHLLWAYAILRVVVSRGDPDVSGQSMDTGVKAGIMIFLGLFWSFVGYYVGVLMSSLAR